MKNPYKIVMEKHIDQFNKSLDLDEDFEYIDNLNQLDDKTLIKVLSLFPKSIEYIINPSITIQKYIANSKTDFYILLQEKDYSSLLLFLKNCDFFYQENNIKEVILKYYNNKCPPYDQLIQITDALQGTHIIGIFNFIPKDIQIKLINNNIDVFRYIENPCDEILEIKLLEDPDELFYIESVSDEIYEKFFYKNNKNVYIPSYDLEMHIKIPKHIIQKYIKCFAKASLENYAESVIKRKFNATPEFLLLLYNNIDSFKIKNKIKKSPNFLDSASLILKKLTNEMIIEEV